MKIKIEDLIEMTIKADDILHDHGFSVNHNILSAYILKTIRESYPNDDIELEKPNMEQFTKFGPNKKDSKT